MDPTVSSDFSRVISPIFSKNDRSFLYSLNNFIEDELRLLQTGDQNQGIFLKEKFLVYKQAFSKIISYVQVYKSLLSRIKREYEFCIGELEDNQLDANQSKEEIIKLESSAETVKNLLLRRKELEIILEDCKTENTRLVANFNEILAENAKYRPNEADNMLNRKGHMTKEQFAFLKEKGQLAEDTRPKGPIRGLSLEKSTDLNYLSDLLNELESKIIEIKKTQDKKYATKEHKQNLEKELFKKMTERDKVHEETANIKNNMLIYKYAMSLSREYYKGNTKYTSIQDALSRGLVESFLNKQNSKTDDEDYSSDLNLENDAEYILEYLENFNDLFDSEKYMQAAYYAAASPRSILRNIETLYKFKKVTNDNDYSSDENDPLFVYCMSVVDSINEDSLKPNVDMSIECIKIVLKYNKLDFLTRLIAQRRISFSYLAAKLIEDYAFFKPKNSKSLFELALFIYKDIKACFEAAVCMAKLDRFSAMLDFINKESELASRVPEIYFKILEQCPSIELACDIMDNSRIKNLKIPIDKIVSILLDSDRPENGLKFLKVQIQKNSKVENNDENLKKLKASYDTLVKFAFLTREDEEFTKSVVQESRDQLNNILINKQSTDIITTKPNDNAAGDKSYKLQHRRSSLKESRRSEHESIAEDDESQEEKRPILLKGDMAYDRRSSVTSGLRSNVNIGVALLEEDEEKR